MIGLGIATIFSLLILAVITFSTEFGLLLVLVLYHSFQTMTEWTKRFFKWYFIDD